MQYFLFYSTKKDKNRHNKRASMTPAIEALKCSLRGEEKMMLLTSP